LEYLYPRLDIEVSKHLNHLLKSPFCVHPGTGRSRHQRLLILGRVCVPIDSSNPAAFDPLAVPTVAQVLKEIDTWENVSELHNNEKVSDWEKTSLKPYVRYFKRHVDQIIADELRLGKEKHGASETAVGNKEFEF